MLHIDLQHYVRFLVIDKISSSSVTMDLIDLHDNSEKLMDDFIRSRLHVENDEVDKDFLDFDHDKLDLIEDEQILPNSCKEKW